LYPLFVCNALATPLLSPPSRDFCLLSVGTDIYWSAFTSTSSNLSRAKSFANGPGGFIFRIEIRYGRSIQAYSAMPEEAEVTLSPNTCLFVTGSCALDEVDGYYYIDLMEKKNDAYVF
jgi:hypothetical protein